MIHDIDEEDETLTQEEIEQILGQFPEFENMTPMDALVMAGTLLDLHIPVPVSYTHLTLPTILRV